MELGPVQEVLDLANVAHHRGHDAAGARFQGAHDRGVVGGGQADEAVQSAAASRAGRLLDLRNRQADVLLVEPDRVESALPGDHLDQLGITELAQREDLDNAVLCQQRFQMRAHVFLLNHVFV